VPASSTILDAVLRFVRVHKPGCTLARSDVQGDCSSVGCNPSMAKLRQEVGVAKAGVKSWGSSVLADVERWNICRLMSSRRRQDRGNTTSSSDRRCHVEDLECIG
jgi:hypothetical protein